MRIPTIGEDVLFCLRAATAGQPAELRPAKITKIWGYGPDRATCDLFIFLNGEADRQMLESEKASVAPMAVEGFCGSYTSASWSPKQDGMAISQFCYMPEKSFNIESIVIEYEITHGREKIRAGAVASWNQEKDTLTFDKADITGGHPDMVPSFAAQEFFNWHMARIQLPEGYGIIVDVVESDGSESPDERAGLVYDIVRQNRDPIYRRMRWYGDLDAPEAGSLRKAKEMAESRRQRRRLPADEGDRPGLEMELPDEGTESTKEKRRLPAGAGAK